MRVSQYEQMSCFLRASIDHGTKFRVLLICHMVSYLLGSAFPNPCLGRQLWRHFYSAKCGTIKPVIKVSAASDEFLDVLGKILAELGKNGSNLNQIAKVLNEFHAPYCTKMKIQRQRPSMKQIRNSFGAAAP